MCKASQFLFLNKVLAVLIGLTLVFFSVHSQDDLFKVSKFRVNKKQPVSPGDLIASCVVETGGDLPHKRYALIYTNFENNHIKMLLEKTVVQWGGWGWSEVNWFSPVTEKKSCRVSLSDLGCIVNLAPRVNIRLRLIDDSGNLSVEKLTGK